MEEESQEEGPELPQYNLNFHWSHEINRPAIKAARNLYFKEYPYERIFIATKVPPSIFLGRCKVWSKMKGRIDEALITKIRQKAVSQQTKEYIEKGLQVGLKFINRLLKREDEITPKDWKLISDSIMALHRVHQLEVGKPTDISVYENMTPEQISAYLLEVQRQVADKHEMSMFAPREDVPEEELLAEYLKKDNEDSGRLH